MEHYVLQIDSSYAVTPGVSPFGSKMGYLTPSPYVKPQGQLKLIRKT